jgi:UTP--glucose-1-phosphate uridylyltransferase
MKKVKKAIIPAAGLGTRFLPATKAQPKEMLPIVDKPTIQYIVEEALASGIEQILIIIGRNKEAIADHFDRTPELDMNLESKGKDELLAISRSLSEMVDLHFVRQKEAKGLGHAVLCAKQFVGDEPFAVMLGDDIVYNEERPCLGQLIEVYEREQASVLGVQRVEREAVSKYGIIDGDKIEDRLFTVRDMVEKPPVEAAPSQEAVLGRYVLSPAVFEEIEKTPKGVGGEIQLTDALCSLAKKERVLAYDFEGVRYDAGDKLGYLKATVEYALRHEEVSEGFRSYLKSLDL